MQLQNIGIAGLGFLGRGIAACLLSRNIRVIGLELDDESRRQAKEYIGRAIEELVNRGGMPAELLQQWPANYVEAISAAEFRDCDFVIESITEDLDAKRALFAEIEAAVGPHVPIASNTSALPITLLQRGRQRPERFVGMHWAEPCYLTRFLEVVRGELTDDATADAGLKLGRLAGKDPTLVRK